jgi:hypothetical protein
LSGLPVDVLSGTNRGGGETGYSLKVKRLPIEQLWRVRQDSNRGSLLELMRKLMLFSEIHGIGKDIYTNDAITIDYGEIELPTSVAERTMKDEWQLQFGLTTEADMLRHDNPDLTREEAQVQFEKNLEEISKNNKLREELGLFDKTGGKKPLNEIQGNIYSRVASTENV